MTDATPYRTAPNDEADDSPPPWWVRHLGAILFVFVAAFLAVNIHFDSIRYEERARVARVAKHGATLAKIHRMTWPEMLRVTP